MSAEPSKADHIISTIMSEANPLLSNRVEKEVFI